MEHNIDNIGPIMQPIASSLATYSQPGEAKVMPTGQAGASRPETNGTNESKVVFIQLICKTRQRKSNQASLSRLLTISQLAGFGPWIQGGRVLGDGKSHLWIP